MDIFTKVFSHCPSKKMWKFSSQLGRRITLFPCLDYVDRGILCPHVFISIHVWSIGDRLLLTGFFHNLL